MVTEEELLGRIRENNCCLLGQIYISEEEYNDLLRYCKNFINTISTTSGTRINIKIAITLVQVAIREYKEGRFWPYFCDALGQKISSAKMNYCGKLFAKTVKYYNLLYIDREEGENQMYVENIKMHAIVTNYYMSGFWEFAFSYYEKNLFRQITDDLIDDIELLSSFMRETLNSNSDYFVGEELEGKASKSYKLLKSTRTFIANNNSSSTRDILQPLFQIIDSYYYDDALPEHKDRFSDSFKIWCSEQEDNQKERQTQKKARFFSSKKPFIHFDFDNMLPLLIIPAQKFRQSEFSDGISAVIEINGHKQTFELETYKSFGIYISEMKKIPIPSLYDEISITIESGIEKKYKISKSNYRLFDDSYNCRNKLVLGKNRVFVEKEKRLKCEGNTNVIDVVRDYSFFDYYTVNISEDSILHVGSRTISLVGEYSEIPYFEEEVNDFEIYDKNERKLIVTRSHPTISFSMVEEKIGGTILMINGEKKLLEDCESKKVSSSIKPGEVAITIALGSEKLSDEGIFEVEIDIPGENNKKIPKYAKLDKLNIDYPKNIFGINEDVYLYVKYGGESVWPIREDVEIVGMIENSIEYKVPIIEDEDYVFFELEMNEKVVMKIPLYILKAGFSLEEMSHNQPEYIWVNELKETLYCKVPDMEEIRIYLNRKKNKYLTGTKIKENIFRVDISSLKHLIENQKNSWDYINIICLGSRKRDFCLFSVLKTLWIEPYFDFIQIGEKIGFDLNIKGNADLYIDVEIDETKEKVIKNRKVINGVNVLQELNFDTEYNIIPRMVQSDEFGLSTNTNMLRPIFKQTFVKMDDLRNYRLPIGDVEYMGEKLELSFDYFVDVKEKINDNTYQGYMYGLKKAKEYSIKKPKYEVERSGKFIKKKLGLVKIIINEVNERYIAISIYSSTYEKNKDSWIEFYYDKGFKTLLHNNDNYLSNTKEYSRFELLDNEYVTYTVMKKKIRRLQKYAI